MPRSVPEWVGKTDSTPVPPRVRLRVLDRNKKKCQECGRKIVGGVMWATDHIVALINGGENREGNLQTLCNWCHDGKTKVDVAAKAAMYKRRAAHTGLKKKSSLGRGKYKKKLDGTVVDRETGEKV